MSDRKYKYGEPTVLVSGFRVPVSKVKDFKDSAYAKLDSYLYSGKSVIGDVEYHEAKTEMPNREFKIKTTEVVSESKIDLTTSFMDPKKQVGKVVKKEFPPIIPVDHFDNNKVFPVKTGYEIIDSVPWGAKMMEVIGHKVHKEPDEETYYVKLSEGKGFKVVVLHSEKEVKDFIRKEIVK